VSASHPSSSFSATLRVHLENRPGSFARLAEAIGEAGGLLDAIDLVRVERGKKVRDVTVLANDEEQISRMVFAVQALDGVEVEHVSDRTFLIHLGGKLEVASRTPVKTNRCRSSGPFGPHSLSANGLSQSCARPAPERFPVEPPYEYAPASV